MDESTLCIGSHRHHVLKTPAERTELYMKPCVIWLMIDVSPHVNDLLKSEHARFCLGRATCDAIAIAVVHSRRHRTKLHDQTIPILFTVHVPLHRLKSPHTTAPDTDYHQRQ